MSGRCQAPPLSDVSSFFVLRSSFFVLNEDPRISCRRSRPPAQERGRRRWPSNERERLWVGGASFATPRQPASKRCAALSPHAGLGQAWVRDRALVFYPGSRGSRG